MCRVCTCQGQARPPGDEACTVTCSSPGDSADIVAQSSRCKRNRKDSESTSDTCKFNKVTSEAETVVNTSVDKYMRRWMTQDVKEVRSGSEEDACNRGEKFSAVMGHEKMFMDDTRKKKSSSRDKMKKIAKKIAKLQEAIYEVEEELEEKAGHPLSKADKIKDEELCNMMQELKKLKKQQKELREKERKEEPRSVESVKIMIETNMDKIRLLVDRPSRLEEMTPPELEAERTDLEEQLEELGGPGRREDRQALGDFFLRLRQLKRMTRKHSYPGSVLDEIPEDLELVRHTRRSSVDSYEEELEEEEQEEQEARENEQEEEEWHTMTETELHAAIKGMKEQKKSLKNMIKDFEQEVLARSGRKVVKEDKEPVRAVYKSYKRTKAKIKLVDALLIKFNMN